jgi:hypothetical protein
MSRSLGVLTLDLIVKTSGFVEGLSKAEKATAKESAKMQKDLEKLTKAGLAVGAAFVAGSIAMVASSIKMADESKKAAQAAGLTTEAFTKLSWAAQQSGLSQEQLSASMRSLNNGMIDAAKGTGTAAAAYKQLGVDVTNADGSLRQGEAVLLDIANAFETMPDGAQKSAIAIDLLGKSGAAMIPLLNGGAKGLNELTTQAERLGLVITDETAGQAELFNDSLASMQAMARGTANTVAKDFLPALSELAKSFSQAAEQGDFVTHASAAIGASLKSVATIAVGAAAAFDIYGSAIGGYAAVVSQIPNGWDAVSSTFKTVKEDLSATTLEYAKLLETIANAGSPTTGLNDRSSATRATGGGFVPVAGASTSADTSKQDKLNADIEALKESFMTEEELLLQKFENEQMLLGEFYAGKEELTQEWQDLSLQSAQRYQESLKAIEKAGFVERSKMTQQALSNLSTLMNGQSRKLFEVGKAAALANAIIAGHEAAVHSYDKGTQIGGPVVGAAFAAASLAATGVQIQAINSTSFGGGKGGTSNTQAVNNASVGTGGAGGGQATPDRNVFIRGISKDSLYSGEQLLSLINNELSNGGKFVAV